jgi:hypothetical protein
MSHAINWWLNAVTVASLDSQRYLPSRVKSRGESGVYPLDGVLVYRKHDKRRARIVLAQLCQMGPDEYDAEMEALRPEYRGHFYSTLEAAKFRLGAQRGQRACVTEALRGWTADVDLHEFESALHSAVKMGGHRLLMNSYRPKL